MDTSTPVSKSKPFIVHDGLRRKAIGNDCELNSNVSNSNAPKSPEEDVELVYSQPPIDSRLNRSEELFPFSPIPYRKEVPSTLLPLLDTPDMKWTSSLFTSFPGQSENASPEVLSEDNLVRTSCFDSHVENNAKYPTNSFFNSEVPGFSNNTNSTNVPPQDSYVERNSSRPSSPIIVTRKKERKFSSVTKELFPFHTTDDWISQEQSPSLECGAMGDMTLNAVEQICMDSEIMYSKNSSKKSNTMTTSLADETTSHFIADISVDLGKNDVIQCKNKRSFIYPFENVKKPVTPVLVTDILQTVLSLETNETSTKVRRKSENFCQGLVCFSQLESSSSQSAENLILSSPLTGWCDVEIENSTSIAATYEVVRVIYLPVFFCSGGMSTSDRDTLTIMKRYLESNRVHFAKLFFESHTRTRKDLSSTFIECSRSKFPKLNFAAAIIDSFFEFFILHPELMYNYRLARRFCVSSNQTSHAATKKRRTQYFSLESKLFDNLVQNLPSDESSLPVVSQTLLKLDQKSSNVVSNKSNVSLKLPVVQKIKNMEEDWTETNTSSSVVLNQNRFVVDKHSFSKQVSCNESDPKATENQTVEKSKNRISERLHKPTLSSFEKVLQDFNATLRMAYECDCVDDDILEQTKKLMERTARRIKSSKKPHVERSAEKLDSADSSSVNTVSILEKSGQNQNSSDLLSKTPFEVDIDSADLILICDLSEKTVLPEKSLNSSDSTPFTRTSLKVTEKSPQHHRKSSGNSSKNASTMEFPCSLSSETKVTAGAPLISDQKKYLNTTVTSTGFSPKNRCIPSSASKSTPVTRSSIKKCSLEPSSAKPANSVITSQKSVCHAQTMVFDDIENWNPELAAMMTPVEIKKQLIHTRTAIKDIERSSSNSEGISTCTNKFAFDGFNTARGRKINVQLNSLIQAKKSMDSVQVEPENIDKQSSNQRSTPCASALSKVDLVPPHVNEANKISTLAEKSSSRQLLRPANDLKLVTIDDGLLPQSSANGKTTSSSSREDSLRKLEFTTDDSLHQYLGRGNQFPAFSTASGKKVNISEKYLAAGKKIYESAMEEKSIDEIIPNSTDPSSRFPSRDSNTAGRVKSRVSASKFSESNIFQNLSVSPRSESEATCHQLDGFSSAAGKKLTVAGNSLKGAEKLYASVSNEVSLEVAQDLQFASFKCASGKKIRVTDLLLEKGKKMYESTTDVAKLPDAESAGKTVGFLKPVLAAKIAEKMNVTDASLRRAQKLFDDCFDDDCMNEIIFNPINPTSSAQLPSFSSAAGKKINVAEKKLFNAQKMLQSVAAETMVSMEKMGDFTDDFLPCRSKILSDSRPSNSSSKAAPSHQRLKRSLIDETLQNIPSCSSNVGKKMKTDENAPNFSRKSDKIATEFKSCEENQKVPPFNCGADSKVEAVSSSDLEKNSTASVSDPPIDPVPPSESVPLCSDENEIFQASPSLDDTVFLNSAVILSDTDVKADYDLPECTDGAESISSKRKLSTGDATLLNLSQEISESASAFLHDMNNDNLAFDPVHLSSCSDAVEEPEVKAVTPSVSRSISPVFDSCKPSHRKRYKKRRSQHTLSLNPLEVTYVRKESDNAADRKSCPEEVLKMFNQNFAQKVNKRKEPSSSVTYPSSKKAKDTHENDNILQQRKQAASEQQKLVEQKDEQLCKPRIGSILAQKLSGNRKSLREIVNYEKPKRYTVSKLLQLGLKRSVVNVSADNANEFIFTNDFLSAEGATYGDECIVIPNEKHEVYFEDLARAFLVSPGVDPRLISLPWIRNHYRWIIWKLASTEKSFPNVFGGRYLTLDNVLRQLKFRYDWEVDRCCRSAVKRILECDSSPSETMILCVASIKTIVASLNEYEIEMTDGWYSVPCLFDGEMMKLLTQKKVTVGTKLMIMNAELTGAGDGCDPLQVNQSARLKIATNSVRRARWYAPLGFYSGSPIIVSDLRAILPNGGTVPQFTAVIARVYPMLYLDKKDDGSFTLHNEKVHFKKMADFEKRRQICVDSLVSQITSEVEKENESMDCDDRNTDSESDPIAYQNRRYHEQERLQILIQERVKQKLPEEFQAPKRASSMLKVRLINKNAHGDPLPAALLTIWHPPEDLVSLLSEGKLYEFHKVVASGLRNGEVQLTANRLTKYKQRPAGDFSCYGRRFTSFNELNTDFKATFGEVDIVGLVISVKEISSDRKNDSSQTIYLADLDKNLMIVKFRTNVKDFGFEDTLKLQNVIAGLNLQWKRGLCNGQIPIVFASELTSFVHSSRCQHLQKCIDKFHFYFKNKSLNDFITECKEKLKDIIASPGPTATSTPERSNSRLSLLIENFVTSEPTNDASLKQNNSADSTDVSWNAKSKSAHSRIEKLRGYGEPPSLSPISMCSRRRSSRLSIQTRVHKLSISKN